MGPDVLVLNFEVDFFNRAAYVTSFEPFLLLESNMIFVQSLVHMNLDVKGKQQGAQKGWKSN